MSRTSELFLLLVLVAVCLRPTMAGFSLPPSPDDACVLKDPTIDPVCMAKLKLEAQANVTRTIEQTTTAILICLGYDPSKWPGTTTRVLAGDLSTPLFNTTQYGEQFVSLVAALAGVEMTVNLVPYESVTRTAIETFKRDPLYYTVWMLETLSIPDLAANGLLQPLDDYVFTAPNLEWMDVHKFYRGNVMYNGSIAAIPLASRSTLLYYRQDILSASNLSVPATWDDLLYVARTLNGTDYNKDGQPEYAACLMVSGAYCGAASPQSLIQQILTSYTQTKGTTSGWLFDADTLNSFIDTEAMRRTLWLLSELVKYSWPSAQCDEISPYMWSGRCAITLDTDSTWKEIQTRRQPNPWRGKKKIVAAMLPGSSQVLDRTTGRLVPCTNTTQCPHATYQYSMALNDTVLVNNAPYKTGVGVSIVNAAIPNVYKPAATQIASSLLTGSDQALAHMFGQRGASTPIRLKTLATDPASLKAWTSYGCNTSDVKDYLTVQIQILDHPNIAPDVRALGAYLYREWFHEAAYMIGNYTAPEVVHRWLIQQDMQLTRTRDRRQFAESVWAGLNIQRAWQYPPPPPQLDTPAGGGSGSTLSAGIIAAIVVPSAAAVLVLAVAAFLAVKRGWVRLGPSGPPKAGPLTTLVVTDVEESTQLWESVPLEAMDETIRLHHGLIRKLLATHHGYESATEGDAFIMAFHTPGQAMDFSYALQQQLLEQPWPAEILQHNVTKPVWAKVLVTKSPAAAEPLVAEAGTPRTYRPRLPLLGHRTASGQTALQAIQLHWRTVPESNHNGSEGTRLAYRSWLSAGDDAKVALSAYKRRWAVILNADSDQEVEQENSHLAYRGLRLRLGLHTGVGEEDVVVNKTNGGLQYTGQSLLTAKSVADSGQGGMIVMTLATFEAWKQEWVGPKNAKKTDEDDHDAPLVLHLGSFVFKKAPELEAVEIYSAVVHGLECRLAVGGTSLRNAEQVAAGVLQAPVGSASVAFCTMVGYSTLLAWNKTLALDALAIFNQKAVELLYEPDENIGKGCEGQYLLELADGLCLAVFGSATTAIAWGLELIESLKQVYWPEELLSHGMCEPVAVAMHNNDGDEDGPGDVAMLFNGPRVKVGIDSGDLTCDVSPATGRLAYRGRSMNRAARIVDKCPSGQVWCSEATYLQAAHEPGSTCLLGAELGLFPMKGLPEPLRLYHCSQLEAEQADTQHSPMDDLPAASVGKLMERQSLALLSQSSSLSRSNRSASLVSSQVLAFRHRAKSNTAALPSAAVLSRSGVHTAVTEQDAHSSPLSKVSLHSLMP